MKSYLLVAAALVVVDQAIKAAVLAWVPLHALAAGGLITYVRNTGITFGFLAGANTAMIFVSIVALGALGWAMRTADRPSRIGITMLLAGVTGNFIDRIVHGAVIDYVRIGGFPVFNLADSLIVTGIIWLLLTELDWFRKRFQNSSKSSRSSR